jgi:catalase (peroxidase I)
MRDGPVSDNSSPETVLVAAVDHYYTMMAVSEAAVVALAAGDHSQGKTR